MECVMLAGLGAWGAGWYAALRERFGAEGVVVVDPAPESAGRVMPGGRWFASLEEALRAEPRPLFLVNAAPPQAHAALNAECFARRIPVLCEKPIAATLEDSRRSVEAACAAGVPFMIAENFRRTAVMRRAAALLRSGAIGELGSLHVQLFQEYRTEKPYWARFRHAFLEDVGIHLLDLARFFTQDEAAVVTARCFNPPGSWHPTNAAVALVVEFRRGAVLSFSGGLASRSALTGWMGDWRLEGSAGALLIRDQALRLCTPSHVQEESLEGAPAPGCLDDFLALLGGDCAAQTLGEDYLRTQELVHHAVQSAEGGRTIVLPATSLGGGTP